MPESGSLKGPDATDVVPREPCEDARRSFSTVEEFAELPMPGLVVAMERTVTGLYACGASVDGGGFLELVSARVGAGAPRPAYRLEQPCVGLSAHPRGLVIWLAKGQAAWLSRDASPTAVPAALGLSGAFDWSWGEQERVVRAHWSAEHEVFFVAAGANGVLRVRLDEARAEGVVTRGLDGVWATDVAWFERRLWVADAFRGVSVYDPESQSEVGAWRSSPPPFAHRLRVGAEGIWAALGASGAALLRLPDDGEPVEVKARLPGFGQAILDVAQSDERLWWLGGESVGRWMWRQGAAQGPTQRASPVAGAFRAVEQAVDQGVEGGVWIAQGKRVLGWRPVPPREPAPRLMTKVGFGSSFGSGALLEFQAGPDAPLWVRRPTLSQDAGAKLLLEGWPSAMQACPDSYLFPPGARFSLRVVAPTQEPARTSVRLESNDPQLPVLEIPVDLSPRRLDALAGSQVDAWRLPTLMGLSGSPSQARSHWCWIEYVPASGLAQQEGLEEFARRLSRLAKLSEKAERSPRLPLSVMLVVGGARPAGVLLKLQETFLANRKAIVGGARVQIVLDSYFRASRSFARTANGRLYPLRALIDPEGRVALADQHEGIATMIGRFKELDQAHSP